MLQMFNGGEQWTVSGVDTSISTPASAMELYYSKVSKKWGTERYYQKCKWRRRGYKEKKLKLC